MERRTCEASRYKYERKWTTPDGRNLSLLHQRYEVCWRTHRRHLSVVESCCVVCRLSSRYSRRRRLVEPTCIGWLTTEVCACGAAFFFFVFFVTHPITCFSVDNVERQSAACEGIARLAYATVRKVPKEMRRAMLGNIYLAGGATRVKGLCQVRCRQERDIIRFLLTSIDCSECKPK
jgi:hypothetical protein